MSNVESETKYEPFSTKRMMAFSLGGIILLTMTDIRGWVQLYMIWGLKLSIYMGSKHANDINSSNNSANCGHHIL